MFYSTIERQLDAKRRIVLPAEFRAALGPLGGAFCFPSFEAACVEGGGQRLIEDYEGLIDELAFGDPLRGAIENEVFGNLTQLTWDPAGRITLPESLCARCGLTDWVCVVGLRNRFQIWDKAAYAEHQARQSVMAREGVANLRESQRQAKLAARG